MKRLIIAVTLALAIGAPAFAQNARRPRTTPRPAQNPTLEFLNQQYPEVSFEEVPLETVMESIKEFTQANIVVKWDKLEENDIDKDKPISLKAKGLRLSQVLWLIMSQAGGSDVKLAYRASGKLLIVSTADDLGKEMVTKVYDVSDLLIRVPQFNNAPRIDPSQALQQGGSGAGGGGGGGGGSNIFENDDEEEDQNDQQGAANAEVAALIELIVETIEPDSWQVNSGLGSIIPWRGQIVVRNTYSVHQQLGQGIEED
jgi:hypothetical protein